MQSAPFYYLVNMSLAASAVIVALLLIRLIRPLPRRVIYPLWALAFLRLAVPVSPSAGWSLFHLAGGLVRRVIPLEMMMPGANPSPLQWSTMNFAGAAQSYAPLIYKTELLRSIFTVGSAVWAIVALAALLAMAVLYTLTLAELRQAAPLRGDLYRSDAVLSPVLVGVFRTKIILPPGLDPDSPQGQLILAHEQVHRQRRDNLWRALSIGIVCVHWFNPLAWVLLRAFLADMEFSCDEAVLRQGKYTSQQRKEYASALLHFAEDKRFLFSAAFGQSAVRVRIIHALNYRRMTWIGAIATAAFVLALALALLSNPTPS